MDIFISLRLFEAHREGKLLKTELERHGLSVFLCAVQEGDSIAMAVTENLVRARLVVILATETYGKETNSSFSTRQEMTYIMEEKKPFFLVKMCDRYHEDMTRFYFNSTIAYFPWIGANRSRVPQELVLRILERFGTIVPAFVPKPLSSQGDSLSSPAAVPLHEVSMVDKKSLLQGRLIGAKEESCVELPDIVAQLKYQPHVSDRLACVSGPNIYILEGNRIVKTITKDISRTSFSCIDFNPIDNNILAVGSYLKVELWDLTSGKVIQEVRVTQQPRSVTFSPNGEMIAVAVYDAPITIWDAVSGMRKFELSGHTDSFVWELEFSPDGSLLASCSSDNSIRLWNVATGQESMILRGKGSQHSVAFSPNGQTLASGSLSDGITIWNISSGEELTTFRAQNSDDVGSVSFSPNGLYLAAGHGWGVTLWDVSAGQIISSWFVNSGGGSVDALFSPDGCHLATKTGSRVQLWTCEFQQLEETKPLARKERNSRCVCM